jgi:hypothetical protein
MKRRKNGREKHRREKTMAEERPENPDSMQNNERD